MTDLITLGYQRCSQLTRAHGKTYYWGTALLPPGRRRHVHAVYALCRLADDIVDEPSGTGSIAAELEEFRARFLAAIDGHVDDPVLAAVGHTVRECKIDLECFDRFFAAMARDLVQSSYRTWVDLCDYMEGSAAVIGEMMLPILEPRCAEAREPARMLGTAFQLTNFLRDIGEDLDRGRIYLPEEDLVRFGADVAARTVTEPWRALMRFEIARNRELYARAAAGIAMLPPAAARCVATAQVLYSAILDRIEAADFDVFSARASVPTRRKVSTAATILIAGPPRALRDPSTARQAV